MTKLDKLKDYCQREIELLGDENERLGIEDVQERSENLREILNNQVAITTLKRVLIQADHIASKRVG